jgi:hypothetical protein
MQRIFAEATESAYRNSVWNPHLRAGREAGPKAARSSRGPRCAGGSQKGRREPVPVAAAPEISRPLAPSDRASRRAPRRPSWTADSPLESLLHDDHTCFRAILAGRGRVGRVSMRPRPWRSVRRAMALSERLPASGEGIPVLSFIPCGSNDAAGQTLWQRFVLAAASGMRHLR